MGTPLGRLLSLYRSTRMLFLAKDEKMDSRHAPKVGSDGRRDYHISRFNAKMRASMRVFAVYIALNLHRMPATSLSKHSPHVSRTGYCRGQLATRSERGRIEDVIWELEMRTPIEHTATSDALIGRWALVYASEDPTRSSPFFWAFRSDLSAFSCSSIIVSKVGGQRTTQVGVLPV